MKKSFFSAINRIYLPGYPRLRREGFFGSACMLFARTCEQHVRRPKYYFSGQCLLNRQKKAGPAWAPPPFRTNK